MPLNPTAAAPRYALELGGQSAGIVTSVQIGTIRAVTNPATVTPDVKKSAGHLNYGDSTVVTQIGRRGTARLDLGARDAAAGTTGSITYDLEVPDFSKRRCR
jgi:hypothetical protein